MIKRLIWAMVSVLGLVTLSPGIASAHVQETSNDVSAVMHILPDDNPAAGKPTLITFSFGGPAKSFSITKCNCQLAVLQDGRTISQQSVEPLDQSSASGQTSVTFPEGGVYSLRLTGRVSQATQFSIPFTVRVDASDETANLTGGVNVVFVSLASLVLVGMIAYYNIVNGQRYSNVKHKEK